MFSSAGSWLPQSSSQDVAQPIPEDRRESDSSISLQSVTSTAPSVDSTPAVNFVSTFATIEEPQMEEMQDSESNDNGEHPDSQSQKTAEVNNQIRSKVYTDAYTHGFTEGYIQKASEPPVIEQMPIAIVGMACRLPGEKKDITTPDEFWELCSRARSGWSEIPEQRFDATSFQHPNPGKSGCFNPAGGCFLKEDVGLFDAPFFSLTAQEATSMDPQQRMLLEVSFEALDSAGIPKHSIVGKEIGVFVGGSFSEYDVQAFSDPDTIPMYQATGCAFAMQSNRLSHFFDLRGPSFTVDTACSSSMVALHQACQSLRNGESKTAIVGSAHLNMIPEVWISYSMSRLFSDEGRSFSFDSRGTGYGRGEGCGVMILKPLDQALKDGDAIRSVIVASGVNQDGKTSGITMPNGTAQEDLMNTVYKGAGISPDDCGYVEAHGTGTKVGDPIEAQALYNVFGEGRSARNPLFVGSVKSNIGHLEAASGIVAVIKTALMLERGFILPNYDYRKPNPKIPLAKWNLKIPISQRPWPRPKRFASVNNFGFGGTNGHVVLERAPFVKRFEGLEAGDTSVKTRMLYVLSANDKSALERLMKNIGIYLEQRPEIFQNDLMSNLSYTLGQRRSFMQWRVAIATDSSFDLVQNLNSGFVFTGQGAQWHAMGRELYNNYAVYAMSINACDKYLISLGASFSLLEELMKDVESTRVHEAHISQPVCTALQIALTDLLRAWNIIPTAVTGHSSGEIGAAYAAGILPLDACMSIAYYRGMATLALKKKHPNLKGAMMAVGCTKEEVMPLISGLINKEARIACFNSPTSLTISGDELAIDELQSVMEQKGLFARKLQVGMAYHSHHMDFIAMDYRSSLQAIKSPVTTDVLFHSSLLGHVVDGDTLEISYWIQNLTRAVRFSEAVSSMCEPRDGHKTGVNMIIEIGPHAALSGPLKQIMKANGTNTMKIPYVSALVRNKDAVETVMALASLIFTKGYSALNVGAVNFPKIGKPPVLLVDLPRYPWNHQTSYWHESRLSQMSKHKKTPRNDLLGSLARYSNELEPTWRNIIRIDDLPWLRHHKIQGLVLFPMSGFISMAIEAISQRAFKLNASYDTFQIRHIVVSKPLVLSDEDVEITLQLRPHAHEDNGRSLLWDKFHIHSWSASRGWVEHCIGLVTVSAEEQNGIDDRLVAQVSKTRIRGLMAKVDDLRSQHIDIAALYTNLSELGVSYGPSFTGLKECRASAECSTGDITVMNTSQEMPSGYQTPMVIHPTVLEQVIQMYWPLLEASGNSSTVFLPSMIEDVKISRKVTELTQSPGDSLRVYCHGQISSTHPKPAQVSMFATSEDVAEQTVIELTNLTVSPIIERDTNTDHEEYRQLCYKLDWEPVLQPLDALSHTYLVYKDLYASELESPANAGEYTTNGNSHDLDKFRSATEIELDVPVTIISGESESQVSLASKLADILEQITGTRPIHGASGSIKTHDSLVIFLNELEKPLFPDITSAQFTNLQNILSKARGVLWTVRGAYLGSTTPDANMVIGFSRSVRSETLLKFATLDMDAESVLDDADTCRAILQVLLATFGPSSTKDCELEFVERCGSFFTPRFLNDVDLDETIHKQKIGDILQYVPFVESDRPLRMNVTIPGAFDTLHFVDQILQEVIPSNGVEVEIKSSGMNHRDGSAVTGKLENAHYGSEFSGVVTRIGQDVTDIVIGDRVAGLSINQGVYSTRTLTDAGLIFKINHNISFGAAASIPSAYCATYYGLLVLGRLVKNEKILIHGAASAFGQAAIFLAQMTGAKVFVTVDSAESKEIMKTTYRISEDRIFSRQAGSFAAAIQDALGEPEDGIDIVLICSPTNSNTLRETWKCFSSFGRLVDLTNQEVASSFDGAHLGMNRTSISIDLYSLATARPKILERLMADVSELLEHGRIKPLITSVFSMTDLAGAFRSLQNDNAAGKIVVTPRPEDVVKAMPSSKSKLLQANATYILIGGTGGLGRDIARWMVKNGAKHVVLVARTASISGVVKDLIDELAIHEAKVIVRQCDVANSVSVNRLIEEDLAHMPPIKGIVHGAMVLKDILFEKMTHEDYLAVIQSKVKGAWNLHNALIPATLDFFITISSAAAAIGNRGQSAYSAANSFLDAFVQYRLKLGLSAASIALTAVSDAGYLAENTIVAAEVSKNLGSDTICLSEVLALMHAAIDGRLSQTCNNHVTTGLRITSPPPFWTNDAKFKHLRIAAEELAAKNDSESTSVSYNEQIRSALSLEEAQQTVIKGLMNQLAQVLMLEEEDMDATRNLSGYALDSLVAIEVRNFITREFEANLQVLELLSSGSIETLAKLICTKSKLINFDKTS